MTAHRVRFAIIAALAALIVAAAPAAAQPQGQQTTPMAVTLRVTGIPPNILEVATMGANGQKHVGQATATPGEFTFNAGDFNSGKPVEVWEIVCDDGTRIVVIDPASPLPPGCRKNRKLGTGIWIAGGTILGAVPSASGTGRLYETDSGFSITPYVSAGVGFGSFGGTNAACDQIALRYSQAAYDDHVCGTDSQAIGWAIGVGTTIHFNSLPVGIDLSFDLDHPRGPSLDTSGDRTSGNLTYELMSRLRYGRMCLHGGPSFAAGLVTVTPQVSLDWWDVEATYTDRLFAGIPQVQVNGGSQTLRTDGHGIGFGVLFSGKAGGNLDWYGRVDYHKWTGPSGFIFGDTATAPWPTAGRQIDLKVGIIYRVAKFQKIWADLR